MKKPPELTTGFDRRSTAAQVLNDIDLHGELAIVTGGYSGIGLEVTRALATAGADVIVPARRTETARHRVGEMAKVVPMNLTDPADVRRFASQLVEEARPIKILINGAGIMTRTHSMVGPEWEAHLAVHHLGPHLLVNSILPIVASEARVVGLSSSGHFLADIRWLDPHFRRTAAYDQWLAYGQSKTAVALSALYFEELLASRGAHAYSVHPGSILTPLQREIGPAEQQRLGWIDDKGNPPAGFKTAQQGAATVAWAATSPLLDVHGGAYLQDCNIAPLAKTDDMLIGGVKPWARNQESAARLQHLSDQITATD